MANLAASAVTIHRAWTEGGIAGKDVACRLVSLDLTGQGGTTNLIPASVLQLTTIEQSSNFITDDNSALIPTSPSADGTYLGLVNLADAVDATRVGFVDLSAVVIKGVVKGYL